MASTPQSFSGLTSADVQTRIARGETNAYKARVGRTYWDIFRDNILNLFNIVLFTLLVVVLFFRDYATVFFAGISVVSNSLLGMFQEISAKRKLDSLAALAVKEARVWRDGQLQNIPIDDIVKDDYIALSPGERLPVDGVIVYSDALEMDESQLTGESDAVMKDKDDPVYSGSFCVAGTGVLIATKVGKESTVNKLSQIAKTYKNVLTPTQQKINTLVQIAVVLMAIAVPMVFISGYVNDLPTLEVFRNAVVFVTSLVPQGLVLTAILSLTIGAISITRFQTLIQRVNAVESMANVTVLCFDKTGTLTRNHLAVQEIIPLSDMSKPDLDQVLQTYIANLGTLNNTSQAIKTYTEEHLTNAPSVTKTREIPFTSARKWGAVILPNETLILGAPERLLDPAHDHAQQAQKLAAEGLRVLALARTTAAPEDNNLSPDREPLALIILSDQIRDDIGETLASFREQNVSLKVISGDNLETVRAIAGQAGMSTHAAYTGDQLEQMTDAELENIAQDADVFARIEPETKRRLVAALKRRGAYVAMVGDGVNDVPALKEAHLAIVMNDGAQITKDVGDIVLLNNAMSTLPLAFTEGRAITQTIYGTSKLFLVKNFYSVMFFIFAGFMSMPFPINPIQISWVTFGVINVPATLIAFRILTPSYMKRFRHDVMDYVITAGIIGATALSLLYAVVFISNESDLELGRTAVALFLTLYGVLVLWNTHGLEITRPSTWRPNWLIGIIGLGLGALTLIIPFVAPLVSERLANMFLYKDTPLIVWGLVVLIFLLAAILLEMSMHTRTIVKRIWDISAP